jgi:hypothetical protein
MDGHQRQSRKIFVVMSLKQHKVQRTVISLFSSQMKMQGVFANSIMFRCYAPLFEQGNFVSTNILRLCRFQHRSEEPHYRNQIYNVSALPIR